MKVAYTILLTALLAGCEILPKNPVAEVPIPANLLTRCENIPNIKEKANMGDLMKYSVELMRQYNECAVRHDGLVEAVTSQQKKN